MLTKSQRKILEKDGWDIVCESPFEMEKCKGFQAPITIDNEEEAKKFCEEYFGGDSECYFRADYRKVAQVDNKPEICYNTGY